jgi:hypothetical protein
MKGTVQRDSRPARTMAVAGVVVLAMGMSMVACTSSEHPSPTSSRPSTTTSTSSTTRPTSSTATTTIASASLGSYLPLFPFSTAQEVQTWQQSYASGGHQPWHLDAGQSALAFAAWLGFSSIDKVIRIRSDGIGAHVSVGFYVGGPSKENVTSAIVHLVHWGTGSDAPWEVVGTDDTTFSLTRPAYGATVTSPVIVGGVISGVDENIKVQVRTSSSSSTLGTFCCLPAGNINTPWNAPVSFRTSSGAVITIAAETGGGVAAVERFTVTGVRVN